MVVPFICLCIEGILLLEEKEKLLLDASNLHEQHYVMVLSYVAMARPIKLLR